MTGVWTLGHRHIILFTAARWLHFLHCIVMTYSSQHRNYICFTLWQLPFHHYAVITLSQLSGNCIFLYSQLITFSAIRGNHIFDKAHLHFLICAAITFYPLRGNHMFTIARQLLFLHYAVVTFSPLRGSYIFFSVR